MIQVSKFLEVHDIFVTTTKSRRFMIDIYKAEDSDVYLLVLTIWDNVSELPGNWMFPVYPPQNDALRCFSVAIEKINEYLSNVDENDSIADVYNPCSVPFVAEADQNSILQQNGINIQVRVNQ